MVTLGTVLRLAQHILSGGHPTHRQGCRTDISSVSLSCISPQDITGSRGFHMDREQVAVATPHKLLCVAIDGSDQSSYALPFFPQVGVSVSATVSFVALSGSFMSMRLLKAMYFRMCV